MDYYFVNSNGLIIKKMNKAFIGTPRAVHGTGLLGGGQKNFA
jgi:hypothetical protein